MRAILLLAACALLLFRAMMPINTTGDSADDTMMPSVMTGNTSNDCAF